MWENLKSWITIVLFCSMIFLLNAEEIKIVTYDFPPYSYKENGLQKGIGTEMVKGALDELELTVDIKEYPQKRAVIIAEEMENVLIYPILRTKENEKNFIWVWKIADKKSFLYRYKNRENIIVESIEDATLISFRK